MMAGDLRKIISGASIRLTGLFLSLQASRATEYLSHWRVKMVFR